MNIAAVILSGGKSTRMGTDKGMLLRDGQLWIDIVHSKLPQGIDCYISVGSHNMVKYKDTCYSLIVDSIENDNYVGSIKALLSAQELLEPYDYVLVLACDMLDVDSELIVKLCLSNHTTCFQKDGVIQPLPFLISQKDVSNLDRVDLMNISLKKMLLNLNAELLETNDEKMFKNYNAPADLGL